MDNRKKFLQKIGKAQSPHFAELFKKISDNDFQKIDVKKLKGFKNIYRVRTGKWRIIFASTEKGNLILEIGTRGDVY